MSRMAFWMLAGVLAAGLCRDAAVAQESTAPAGDSQTAGAKNPAAPARMSAKTARAEIERLGGGCEFSLWTWSVWMIDLNSDRIGVRLTDDQLDLVLAFPKVVELDLSGSAITNEGLKKLRALKHLQTLYIHGAEATQAGVTVLPHVEYIDLRDNFLRSAEETASKATFGEDALPEELDELAARPDLEHLEIFGAPITHAQIAQVGNLSQLRSLDIRGVRLRGDDYAAIGRLTKLDELTIDHRLCRTTDAELAHLSGLRHVQNLNLGGSRITDAGLQSIAGYGALRFLDLRDNRLTDAGLVHLAKLGKLEHLCLDATLIRGPGLAHLQDLPDLVELELQRTNIDDAGLKNVSFPPTLLALNLSETRVTGVTLPPCPRLQALALTDAPVSDEGLARIGSLSSLMQLRLMGGSITDEGLPHLVKLSKLYHLDVSRTRLTGTGFSALGNLQSLSEVRAEGSQLNDEGLAGLASLRALEECNLKHTRITDAGLVHLKPLRKILKLNLDGTDVTDAGLQTLGELKSLEFVSLFGTQTTAQGVARLRKALPRCDVTCDPHAHDTSPAMRNMQHEIRKQGGGGEAAAPAAAEDARDVEAVPYFAEDARVLDHQYLHLTDAKLAHAPPLKHVEKIDLDRAPVTGRGLASLAKFPNLKVLVLDDRMYLGESEWESIARLSSLEVLKFPFPGRDFSDDDCARLAGLIHLECVDVKTDRLTDAGLRHLARLPCLKYLRLANSRVTDEGLATLSSLKNLEALDLAGTLITDAGLVHLRHTPRLRALSLRDTHVTGPGLTVVADLLELQHLDLSETNIGDDALPVLAKLQKLESLRLEGTPVTAAALPKFAALQDLVLKGSDLTDDGLARAAACPRLKFVDVSETEVGDAGLRHCHDHLHLYEIFVYQTNISFEGIQSFRGANRHCRIEQQRVWRFDRPWPPRQDVDMVPLTVE